MRNDSLKALLDAGVELHEPRVRVAQTAIMTSTTRLKQRVAMILKSGSLCVIATALLGKSDSRIVESDLCV